jgi:hypothetical protein
MAPQETLERPEKKRPFDFLPFSYRFSSFDFLPFSYRFSSKPNGELWKIDVERGLRTEERKRENRHTACFGVVFWGVFLCVLFGGCAKFVHVQ